MFLVFEAQKESDMFLIIQNCSLCKVIFLLCLLLGLNEEHKRLVNYVNKPFSVRIVIKAKLKF